jgi:enoyl-CoA hydratase/carnithine racemase
MEDRIRLTIADGIADVRLNRSDKMNALDPATFRAIAEAGVRLKDDRSLRAVVLSGEGPAFCAGLDVERVAAMAAGSSILLFADLAERTHGMANYAQHIVWLWRELPVPVIAAVHGVAFGGGFQLTLAPICATSRRVRVCRSSRPNGAWCRTWLEPSSCVTWRARTWSAS